MIKHGKKYVTHAIFSKIDLEISNINMIKHGKKYVLRLIYSKIDLEILLKQDNNSYLPWFLRMDKYEQK